MTKSELFKAAHKLAKMYKKMNNGFGDYIAYVSFALKALNRLIKAGKTTESIFSVVNKGLKQVGLTEFFTKTETQKLTHGQLEFDAIYKLENARKELKDGKFFGKVWNDKGLFKVWVRSNVQVEVAY